MLHLVQSNKMEVLAAQLCQQLASDNRTLDNLFTPQPIWVQSPGMAQWLKLQVAESLGIAANLEFPLPSSFIWNRLYLRLLPDLPKQSAFTKDNMTWKLMAILPDLCQQPAFGAVAGYLGNVSQPEGLKLFQLCQKIADLFDQYLVYRPDWLQSWEQGARVDNLPDSEQEWQAQLWRALGNYTESLGESPWHRGNLHHSLLEKLQQQDCRSFLPSTLLVFGISALPAQQLEILDALARQIEVVIFWFNPSQQYWGDIVDEKRKARAELAKLTQGNDLVDYLDVGNPLLASWGKLGQDFQDMLLERSPQQHDLFVEHPPQNLLEHIQHEILNLTLRGSTEPLSAEALLGQDSSLPRVQIEDTDNSLMLVSCHSRLRELEVLHDHLLAFFREHPDNHPGDVIVMMPDVAAYAPLIHGVFGGHRQELSVPYAISDRSLSEESPLLNSFISLNKLHLSRLSLAEVLDILEVPAILRRFELSDAEFAQLRRCLLDVGVRWGLDGEDKQRWQLPTDEQNTWLFGLKRLISGYAMQTELYVESLQGKTNIIAPYAELEGQSSQVLGKLLLFLQQLTDWLGFCQRQLPLAERIDWVQIRIEQMYEIDAQDEGVWLGLREALSELAGHHRHYAEAIDQQVFCQAVQQRLQESGVGQRFLAGSVNFCTLMPMRSVPFKLVCLLGMNDTDYPRQVTPVGFDLMQHSAGRKGDRSRRLDDKYLFMEALLSARQQLYISFQGRSARDNQALVPSVLLSELLDYCRLVYCDSQGNPLGDELIKAQHLQPFHPDYFQVEQPRSFDSYLLTLAKGQSQPPESKAFMSQNLATIEVQGTLGCEELISFLLNPARGFFQLRWQARFGYAADSLEEDEPFVLDSLQRYQLLDRLVAWQHSQASDEVLTARLRAEGLLPGGHAGTLALQGVIQQASTIRDALMQYCLDHQPKRELLHLELNGISMQGWQDHLYANQLVLWRAGKVRARDKLSLWLRMLMLCANGYPLCSAVYVGTDSGTFELKGMPQQQALEQLSIYVQAWQNGHNQPLLLLPECGWLWLEKGDMDRVLTSYMGNDFARGEGQEAHTGRIWPDLAMHQDEFIAVSDALLGPLFNWSQA
ncbi:exodeoxyribonuclease V subunit gamma [Bowmanella yangjiangensis]|uniref:RecBCD enzyme subunit RecC n=1 Tax=Bowmanella yangjiangensis TaxID=2811230 RepID=A0ABS3CS53_9ALTE|nr:exodeoxyribonuclease V subunit gamma [Bowmanella yangjiangensis]MBN7819953.1 exodeoxyribonuclease V subunit gamma [Bowmanella yangjiangensis]